MQFSALGVPSSTPRMLRIVCAPIRSTDSAVTPAMCGALITFGSLSSGLSTGVGSTSNTSSPAPASLPVLSAACSAGSSMIPPRAVFTR